jgi:hypothetical protein
MHVLTWTTILLLVFLHVAGMTDMYDLTQPLMRWSLISFLPGTALNCYPPNFSLLSSWYYRL